MNWGNYDLYRELPKRRRGKRRCVGVSVSIVLFVAVFLISFIYTLSFIKGLRGIRKKL